MWADMWEVMAMGEHAERIASAVYQETRSETASAWVGLLALIIEELVGSGYACGALRRPVAQGADHRHKDRQDGLGCAL